MDKNNRNITPQRRAAGSPAEILEKESDSRKPLVRINFILMAVAGAMIVLGFLLMVGGASDGGEFNPEIFSSRRIMVGPTIAFLGFLFMGVGIMYSPRKTKDSEK